MRKSDFVQVEERYTFSIEVEDEKGERSTVLVGAKAQTQEGSGTVLFDRDGLAYMRKDGGSLLLHLRAPQYDLDQGEAVTVTITEPVESYFPVLVYDQDNLGGEPTDQAQVRYLSYQPGEPRLLSDEHGNTYAARPDNKPGVVLIEDPASITASAKRKR